LGAAEPQARVVETAIEVLVLIDELRPAARAGLLADLVAADEVARAGSAIGNVKRCHQRGVYSGQRVGS